MGGQEVFARNPLWQGVPAIWYANLRQFALAYLAVAGGDAGIRTLDPGFAQMRP